MTSITFKALLEKYRTGSLDSTERALLQQWLHQPDKRAELEALFDENLDDAAFQGLDDPELLNLMYQQIQMGMEPRLAKQGKWRRMTFFRVAAAAILLLAIGSIWFWWPQKSAKPTPRNRVVQGADIPAPTEIRALLTLADGRVIPLESVQQGLIAAEGNASIEMQANGEIRYNSNNKATETVWNTISIPRGSKPVRLVLADGSRVWLNVASSLRYPVTFSGNTRQVDITGEAYFEIEKIHNNGKEHTKEKVPFIVNIRSGIAGAPLKGQVEVLGTHFNVNAYDDERMISTSLMEGSVKVTPEPAAFQPAIIRPGQQAAYPATGQGAITVREADMEEVMAWKNGKFSFTGESLAVIMRQLGRWYNLEIVFEDEITDPYTISISRDVPLSKLIQYIELSSGAKIELQGRKLLIRKSK